MDWHISGSQKELLDALFEKIECTVESALDVGAGRTSVFYLADRYKDIVVDCVVYPGDERKIGPIKECVGAANYRLVESDIMNFQPEKNPDVILAHLFLAEAAKFGGNDKESVYKKLFAIPAKYLVLVNLSTDNIDYHLLLKLIADKGDVVKISHIISEGGDDCLGMTVKVRQE